jgi:hypothetical protein
MPFKQDGAVSQLCPGISAHIRTYPHQQAVDAVLACHLPSQFAHAAATFSGKDHPQTWLPASAN